MTKPPLSPAYWLAALLGAWLLAHWGLSVLVPGPYIFPDELIYLELARHLAHGDGFMFRGEPMRFPTVLFPLVLVPAQWAGDPTLAFRLAQATSTLLMGAAAVPVYLLARRLLSARWAIAATALAMVAPYTIYAHTVMAEGLFLALLMGVAYATLQALIEPGRRWKLLLGLLLGLAFFAKPQGMLLAPVVVATFVLSEGWRRQPGFARRLAAFWPAVAVFVPIVGLHALRTALSVPGADLTSLATYLGTYSGGLSGKVAFTWGHFFTAAAGIGGATALSLGFWPLALFVPFAWRTARAGSLVERVFLTFAVLTTAMLLGLASQNVAIIEPRQVQERYTFYVGPLILIGALQALARGPVPWRAAGAVAIVALALSVSFVERAAATYVDTPAYMAMYRPWLSLGWRGTELALAVGGLAYLAVLAVAWARGARRLPLALAVAYGLTLTGLAVYGQSTISGVYLRDKPFVAWVQAHAASDRPIALVSDGLPYIPAVLTDVFSRQTVHQFYMERPHAAWLERRLTEMAADGELLELSALPDGTRIVAHRSVPLALPVLAQEGQVVIYEKRGRVRRGR